jgi:hypothetical protein
MHHFANNLCCEIFFAAINVCGCMLKMLTELICMSSLSAPQFLPDFNHKWNISTNLSPQYQISWNSLVES